jgi:hypothetical protein
MLTKLEAAGAILSFALVLCGGVVRIVATRLGVASKTAEALSWVWMLGFFFIFGICCIGLMIHVFVILQTRIGNGAAPMVRFLVDHETGVTLGFWAFLALGALIAIPFALQDLGMQLSLGKSKGTLVADIGMTMDEVKARSSLPLKEPTRMGDGSLMAVQDQIFDYRIGDSSVVFPQSRYYWLTIEKGGDRRLVVANIGITPRKMPRTELDAFQRRLQEQLSAEGWMPGHYVAHSEETVRLWSGKRTTGDGRYWTRGNTLLIFEVQRMDEEQRDEPPGSGEFILYLDLRPKDHDRDLVFEPSAWQR